MSFCFFFFKKNQVDFSLLMFLRFLFNCRLDEKALTESILQKMKLNNFQVFFYHISQRILLLCFVCSFKFWDADYNFNVCHETTVYYVVLVQAYVGLVNKNMRNYLYIFYVGLVYRNMRNAKQGKQN